MKKYLSLLLIALMFCAVVSAGCGGGGSNNDSADSEQTESLNNDTGGEDTGSEDTTYDPNEEGRGGNSGYTKITIEHKGIYVSQHISFYVRLADGNWYTWLKDRSLAKWDDPITFYIAKDNLNYFDALGFEFDVFWGTDWPYSGVFWTMDESVNRYNNGATRYAEPDNIYIVLDGYARNAWITITVDDEKVVEDYNCDRHSQYKWE